MSNQEYTQLLEYLDERFTGIDFRFDKIEQRLDGIDITIDGMMKLLLSHDQEQKISNNRINNIEDWIKKPLEN